jgi:hypothetical protein
MHLALDESQVVCSHHFTAVDACGVKRSLHMHLALDESQVVCSHHFMAADSKNGRGCM